MYYFAMYTSLVLALLLIPFLIPLKSKNRWHRNIKSFLIIALIVSSLITLTPQIAVDGAPIHKYGSEKIAFLSCNYQIVTTTKFCEEDNYEYCYCANPAALATISHCFVVGHPKEIHLFLNSCKENYNITITHDEFRQAHHDYLLNSKSIDEIEDYSPAKVVHFPVKMNESQIISFKDSFDRYLGNYDKSIDYGGYAVLYWVVAFIIIAACNWSKMLLPRLIRKYANTRLLNWIRKNITLPATKGRRKTDAKPIYGIFDMLIPSRIETILLTGYFAFCFFLTVHDISYSDDDILFHSRDLSITRSIAVRASILTSSSMPLLILFGGRNNFLQWFTKWDYATFITLHRWVSRVIFVLVVLHSLFYTYYLGGISSPEMSESYITWGKLGTFSGLAIMIQGLLVLRRKYYETFLLLHIILAAIFIIGAWMHVLNLYCSWFYYYTAAIWAFDRIIRIGRLISFGFHEATVKLLPDQTLRVEVPTPSDWEAVPGGHVFIHFLRPSSFWQSHPFTYIKSSNQENTIVLFIKVKRGVTYDLFNELSQNSGNSTKIRVAVEGSYGESLPVRYYDNSVFIAGGSGIPGIYSEAVSILNESHDLNQYMKLIWIIRDYQSIISFYDELMALKDCKVELCIYITKPDLPLFEAEANTSTSTDMLLKNDSFISYNSIESNSAIKMGSVRKQINKDILKLDLSFIKFKEGRPNIEQIVSGNIKASTGSICFVACGHPVMVDDVRASIVQNIDINSNKRIDYFEQLQVWS
ncbi:ferric reductase [Scheffersomyces coipomensis]|uniref:ferric reductase n=1 Tax=Scheffersomyces coipomensis TaxID=1788519 RepID=UPI00315C8ACB